MFFEAWADLVADFQSTYGVDLEHLVHDPTFTWRRFAFLATGLLAAPASIAVPGVGVMPTTQPSRIYRRFAPRDDD